MRTRGFTMVEVLVAVAIIAVLATLGASAVFAGLARAKQVHCANNMRQIGVALTAHALNNNGFFPETTHTVAVNKAWIAALEDEMGPHYDDLRLCPADPHKEERRERGGTSYILNSYIFVPEIGPFGEELSAPCNNMQCIDEPARTLMAFIVSEEQTVEATMDHTHSRGWTRSWENVLRDIQPDRHRTGRPDNDHSKGSANYLFIDGHVETWRASDVKQRIESGENFAEPPNLREDA